MVALLLNFSNKQINKQCPVNIRQGRPNCGSLTFNMRLVKDFVKVEI